MGIDPHVQPDAKTVLACGRRAGSVPRRGLAVPGWRRATLLLALLWGLFCAGSAAAQVQFAAGVWWNPQTPGTGFVLEVNGGRTLFTVLSYRSSGTSAWYQAVGTQFATGIFDTGLVEYAGGQTLAGPWQPPGSASTVTQMSLTAVTTSQASLILAGGSTIQIQRYEFVDGGLAGGVAAAAPQTGWWWNPAEPGRGYFIETQGAKLFLIAMMYETDGSSRWYAATGDLIIGPFGLTPTATATLSEYSGGSPLTGSYTAPRLAATKGQIALSFSSTVAGVLTLPNGSQIPIARYTNF
jgi:hypothetical protein